MNHETLTDTLRAALPSLVLEDEIAGAPEGHTRVGFEIFPIAEGVRLRIKIEDGPPYSFDFASDLEAADFLAHLGEAVD